jgi:hypothetical protein
LTCGFLINRLPQGSKIGLLFSLVYFLIFLVVSCKNCVLSVKNLRIHWIGSEFFKTVNMGIKRSVLLRWLQKFKFTLITNCTYKQVTAEKPLVLEACSFFQKTLYWPISRRKKIWPYIGNFWLFCRAKNAIISNKKMRLLRFRGIL